MRRQHHQLLDVQGAETVSYTHLTTGTVKLKARFDNAEQMLFPNQFVNVRLRVETHQAATIVPSAAVQFGTRGTFVYVVDDANKVSIRPVSIAASDAERSMVSEGCLLYTSRCV